MFYWFLKWIAVGPLLRMVFRPRVDGAENVPPEGPAILASNHLSYADWLFMPLTLPRRVTFVAKEEYFTNPGLKGWLQRTFFSGAGQVPIDRSGADAAAGALTTAKRVLGEGELFGIYPEGTRSPDGRLYRGRTGVARIALETRAPVVPVAVVGTNVVAPPGKKFGSWTRPVVRFGAPLDFSRYEGLEGDRFILRSVTDEIMYEIMRLSGQEYVDVYATRAKALEKGADQGPDRAKARAETGAEGTAGAEGKGSAKGKGKAKAKDKAKDQAKDQARDQARAKDSAKDQDEAKDRDGSTRQERGAEHGPGQERGQATPGRAAPGAEGPTGRPGLMAS